MRKDCQRSILVSEAVMNGIAGVGASAYNDYRMAKTIDTSIVFAAKRHVWQRMI
jgi:hypothetical protein